MNFSISTILLIVAVFCLLVALFLICAEHNKKNIEEKKEELVIAQLTPEKQEEAKRKEIFHLKARLQTYPKRIKMQIFYIVFSGIYAFFYIWISVSLLKIGRLILFLLINLFSVGIAYFIEKTFTSIAEMSSDERRVYEYEISHAQDKAEEDPFTNSIKTSYKYLDLYYAQTREQAQKGFYITLAVALFGAALIGVGVVALFQEKITPAYITCASGAITEFISAVFFYLYNKTVTSMNSYHDKLVLSQNIAFALRIAGEMEGMGEKNKAKLAIINELVKDVNAQMMKSYADTDEPPKKDKPSDSDTSSQ